MIALILLGESVFYWLAAVVCGVAVAGPGVCSLLERRQDARDRALWERMYGASR